MDEKKSSHLYTTSKSNSSSLAQNNLSKINKPPWSFKSMLIVAFLTGTWGSYLITWQNLKRLGQEKEAKKFLLVNTITMLVVTIISFLIIKAYLFSLVVVIFFAVWLNSKYLKKWDLENPKVAKFSWSLVGWGLIGVLVTLTVYFILYLIFPQIF